MRVIVIEHILSKTPVILIKGMTMFNFSCTQSITVITEFAVIQQW